MAEVKWFKTTQELHDYVRAEAKGQAGEEFRPKVIEEPAPKKKAKKGKENE